MFLFFCPNDSQKPLLQQGVSRAGFGLWAGRLKKGRFRGCVGAYESLVGDTKLEGSAYVFWVCNVGAKYFPFVLPSS